MTRAGTVATAIWAVCVLVAALIVLFAHYTTDLSAFLPRSPTATQRLLVDQLREGIASRLILIGIEGADTAERARISRSMGKRLRTDPQFVAVNNGEAAGADRDRDLLFDHRYLLSEAVTPEHFTTTGLRDAIQATLDTLASPAGEFIKTLIPRDPTGETLQIVDQLGSDRQPPTEGGVWASRDGKRALMVAQTRATGSDTDGQQEAVEAVRRAFEAAVAEQAAAGGPGAAVAERSGAAVAQGSEAPGAAVAERPGAAVAGRPGAAVAGRPGAAVAEGSKPAGAAVADGSKPAGAAVADGSKPTGAAVADGSKPTGAAVAERPGAAVAEGSKPVGAAVAERPGAAVAERPGAAVAEGSKPVGAAVAERPGAAVAERPGTAVAEGSKPTGVAVADGTGAAPSLEMSGPGVFSVSARATIKGQVALLSVVSLLLITLMLLWVYRSVVALALGLVPVATGALAGIAAVALGFGSVHGITLGFGVTLIGESVDYSIYLFIQANRELLWPTIRLGVLTSTVGFASLLPSAFPGLAQLGLFSISGLLAAALVTRYVLPNLAPHVLNIRDLTPLGNSLAAGLRRAHLPAVVFLLVPIGAALVLYFHRGPIWNPELSALSPVSEADHALDAKLRADVSAPDVSYLVIVSGPGQEAVLHATEVIDSSLDALVEQGTLAGFASPARYLPSLETQKARQQSLPDAPTLRERLTAALQGMPIRPERLEPFLHDVEAARQQPLLTREALTGTSLATGVDALLIDEGTRWHALLPLQVPGTVAIDVGRVHSAISKAPLSEGLEAVVLDVKGEVDRLYTTYLSEALRLSAAGFAGIVVLLLVFLRSFARTLKVVAPLVLAVLVVVAALVLLGQQLTILHLIGMLLIVAVGSNYALFFDRRAHDPHAGTAPLTLASLLIANAATVLGFGVLSFSSVPILQALGATVAPGAFLALLFSALLTQGA